MLTKKSFLPAWNNLKKFWKDVYNFSHPKIFTSFSLDNFYDINIPKDIFNSETNFEIGSVNILDNENRKPINYVLPPGVEREKSYLIITQSLDKMNNHYH